MVSSAGAMSNPFEFRELMAASVGYDERSVEQVQSEHAARAAQRKNEAKSTGGRRRGRNTPSGPAPASAAIPTGSLKALDALKKKVAAAK